MPQLELFDAFIGDIALRDDREALSLTMFGLSKKPRTDSIEWRMREPDAEGRPRYLHVSHNGVYGMATIWDYDILIWMISQVAQKVRRGEPHSPVIRCSNVADLLRIIGRGGEPGEAPSGQRYQELTDALYRLQGTLIATNIGVIRQNGTERRRPTGGFNLLQYWRPIEAVDALGNKTRVGLELTLADWFYEAAVVSEEVLKINPDYFKLKGGYERWLYRIARRHAHYRPFEIGLDNLHERAASTQRPTNFAAEIRSVLRRNDNRILEYSFEMVKLRDGRLGLAMDCPNRLVVDHPLNHEERRLLMDEFTLVQPRYGTKPKKGAQEGVHQEGVHQEGVHQEGVHQEGDGGQEGRPLDGEAPEGPPAGS